MGTLQLMLISAVLVYSMGASTTGDERAALDEDYGYVTVRKGAYMFWVVYHTELSGDYTDYPLIMWLQGGPGASSVGYGNFMELGPYDVDYNRRDSAWTKKANVMFVDNPVGTGYSYVDDLSYLTSDNEEIAQDLVTLMKSVLEDYPDYQKMPFFVYAESYGGKMTVDFALALDAAIKAGEIQCDFRGVALGDSWISPMDSVNTWGMFLYQMGFVNEQGRDAIDEAAAETQASVDAGQWIQATLDWSNTESVVLGETNGVNFYNVLAEDDIYRQLKNHSKDLSYMKAEIRQLYQHHVASKHQTRDALYDLMNGEQADRWNIPSYVTWDGQGGYVFNHLAGDFMKPVISSVEQLLSDTDIHVAVFTGDLDLICDTPGTYRWIEGMDWAQKPMFENTERDPKYITTYSSVAAYVQRHKQLSVFTILRSGHMVPIDAPEMALQMIDLITEYGTEKREESTTAKGSQTHENISSVKKDSKTTKKNGLTDDSTNSKSIPEHRSTASETKTDAKDAAQAKLAGKKTNVPNKPRSPSLLRERVVRAHLNRVTPTGRKFATGKTRPLNIRLA